MEYSSPHSVTKGVRYLRRKAVNIEKKFYKHGLSFYKDHPDQTILLDDLIKFADERLSGLSWDLKFILPRRSLVVHILLFRGWGGGL